MSTPTIIREARLARDLGVRELAERCGISHAALSRIERGRLRPSSATILVIARALGLGPRDVDAVHAEHGVIALDVAAAVRSSTAAVDAVRRVLLRRER
jgi:transcriptional regulator with XRE-family HTH domain